jgi:hypothetical protein
MTDLEADIDDPYIYEGWEEDPDETSKNSITVQSPATPPNGDVPRPIDTLPTPEPLARSASAPEAVLAPPFEVERQRTVTNNIGPDATSVSPNAEVLPREIQPSPSVLDVLSSPQEGPPTPRNDAGPFVLDGGVRENPPPPFQDLTHRPK